MSGIGRVALEISTQLAAHHGGHHRIFGQRKMIESDLNVTCFLQSIANRNRLTVPFEAIREPSLFDFSLMFLECWNMCIAKDGETIRP